MNKKIQALIATSSLFTAMPGAFADFHLWTINEVFTNADGTVQFIELSTTVTG